MYLSSARRSWTWRMPIRPWRFERYPLFWYLFNKGGSPGGEHFCLHSPQSQSIKVLLSPASGPLLGIQELRYRMSSLEATGVPRDATRAGCVIACDSDHISQAMFSLISFRILNSETLHERYWEVSRLLCSVVGCGTDWQQETRSSVFSFPLKNLQYSFQTLPCLVAPA